METPPLDPGLAQLLDLVRRVVDEDRSRPVVGLGPGDVVTVAVAARALRMRTREARAWLQGLGVIRVLVGGRERIIWGDVLAAIRGEDEVPQAGRARPRRKEGATLAVLPREAL